jgi:hypothetical protein
VTRRKQQGALFAGVPLRCSDCGYTSMEPSCPRCRQTMRGLRTGQDERTALRRFNETYRKLLPKAPPS